MALGNDVTLKVGFDIDKFQAELKKTNGILDNWANSFSGALAGVAAGFSAMKVAEFALDVSKLAGEAEGVRAAFDRLEGSVTLMAELKKATNNTVSELDLMKRAVMASNFDISLQALPKLLEFATLRAKQTGQSVDYLVDSIVTGIGRKSKLILDNLGISAVQLDEALGGASTAASTIGEVADAVGRIAEENLKNMAGFTDDAKTSIDKLGASWVNLKIFIGEALNETGLLKTASASLVGVMDVLSNKTLTWAEKLDILASPDGAEKFKKLTAEIENTAAAQEKLLKDSIIKQADQAIKTFGFNLKAIGDAYKQNINYTAIMAEITKRQTDKLKNEAEAAKAAAKAYNELFHSKAKVVGKTPEGTTALQKATIPTPPSMPDKVGSPFGTIITQDILDANAKSIDQYNALAQEIMSINQEVRNSWMSLAESSLVAMATAFGSGEPIGKAFLKSLASFGIKFGAMLIKLGIANIAIGNKPKGVQQIAAGVALVAAGAALASSSAASGSSGGGRNGSVGGGSDGGGRQFSAQSQNITVNGEFRLRGSDLVASMNNAQANNYYRKGG